MLDKPKIPSGLEPVLKGLQRQQDHMNITIGNTVEALVTFLNPGKSPEELKEIQEDYYKIFRETFKDNTGVDPLTNISSGIPTVTSYSREGGIKRFTMKVQAPSPPIEPPVNKEEQNDGTNNE